MADALGIRSPLAAGARRPCSAATTSPRMDMASAYSTFANRGDPGAARARHPDHPRRRHGAVQPRAPPDQGARGRHRRHRHEHPRAGDRARHRHAGQARPAGGGQDRHRPTTTRTPGSPATRPSWPPPCGSGSPSSGRRQLVRCAPPDTPITVTGGTYPAEIWQRFMSAALAGRPAGAVPARRPPRPPSRPLRRPPPARRGRSAPLQPGARRASALPADEATDDPPRGRLPRATVPAARRRLGPPGHRRRPEPAGRRQAADAARRSPSRCAPLAGQPGAGLTRLAR